MNITGRMLRDAIISGANNISNKKEAVNELNVFPVPDGDTGTNMSMTIGSSVAELNTLPDDVTVEKVASVAASSLLRGARGNSGVILSLLFRGFQRELKGKAEMTADDIRASLAKGVTSAYKAVMSPAEGTILTVARVASENASASDTDDAVELWDLIVSVSEDTLLQTPEMLPVLKKAGVVDSGGQGLVYIFRGMQIVFNGGSPIEGEHISEASSEHRSSRSSRNTAGMYHVEFTLTQNDNANILKLQAFMDSCGSNVSVTGHDNTVKCAADSSDPGKILSEAIKHGFIDNITVIPCDLSGTDTPNTDETSDTKENESGKESASKYVSPDDSVPYGFVSVSSGDGLAQLFTDLGVDRVVSGGQTMNPSTDDILAAVQSIAAKNIFILANNKNIIMASEQACALADRNAMVLPTRTIPQGISAMLAFSPDETVENNFINMTAAADNVATGQVTFAARDSEIDGKPIRQGEIMGIMDGKLVSVEKSLEKATLKLAKKIIKKTTGFVTLICGADVTQEQKTNVEDLIRSFLSSDTELSVIDGGQPVYYFYISAE